MDDTELFTRDEVSTGLPARRARARLYLIENRAALLAARERRAVQPWRTEATEAEHDLAFLAAFAQGKEPPVKPTVQDLERYAPSWAELVPENTALRAALAHALGEKYSLVYSAVPGIRAALGLDTELLAAVYLRRYGAPLSTIYTTRPRPAESLRWGLAALERWFAGLSPFWAAFALTFTEVLGAGALALPIALAGIGPLPGLVFLVVFGLINILTIAALTESVTRHGGMHYGAFFSQLFRDLLSPQSAALAAAGLVVINAMGLVAYFDGFATTLAGMIPLPPLAWMALLGLVVLYFLRGNSMDATIGTTLIISAVNLFLILALLLLTLPHVQPEYLLYVNLPFAAGQPFDPSLLGLVFGTVSLAFFGHTAVMNGAGVILRRDPGGNSFVRGAIAAEVIAILLYSVWLLAINGSVPAETLAATQSTVLTPLATVVGPAVNVFGLLFMILAVAIASIQVALGLFNLVREWLPAPQPPTVVLPRRQGQLLLAPRRALWSGHSAGRPALRLTYFGPAGTGRGRFRIQAVPQESLDAGCEPYETTIIAGEDWDAACLDTPERSEHGPEHRPGAERGAAERTGVRANPLVALGLTSLRLQVQEATAHWVRLRVVSPWAMRFEGAVETVGLQMADLLELPAEPAQILNYLMRAREAALSEIAAATGQDPADVSAALAELQAQGQVQVIVAGGQARYRAQLGHRRVRHLPTRVAEALDEPSAPPTPTSAVTTPASLPHRAYLRLSALVRVPFSHRPPRSPVLLRPSSPPLLRSSVPPLLHLGPSARFWLAASPIFLIWVIAAVALLTGSDSFTAPMAFSGTIVASLLCGIFPALLLAAGRRKGDLLPASAPRFLGHPLVLGAIFFVYWVGILLHGLVIWQDPVQRLSALVTVGLTSLVTLQILRRGYLRPRLVVELRHEAGSNGAGLFAVNNAGCAAPANVCLTFAPSGEEAAATRVEAPAGPVPDFARLRAASFTLPVAGARDLKVWVHRASADGLSEPLPAVVEVSSDAGSCTLHPEDSAGQVLVPLQGAECEVRIALDAVKR